MKRKSEFTTLERAIQTVDGFSHVFTTLRQQTALCGQSECTLYNYMNRICLLFNRNQGRTRREKSSSVGGVRCVH